MHHPEDNAHSPQDPLGEVIRAAGRRPAPPREHYETVLAASRAAWQQKVRARRKRRWYALAACLGVMAAAGALFQALQPPVATPVARLAAVQGQVERLSERDGAWVPVSEPGLELPAGTRMRTGGAGLVALTIRDGGSLRINSGTELVIGEDSIELESGMIYFDSRGRSVSAPVRIATAFGIVQDAGTQFEVFAGAESLRVRVREGEVELLESALTGDLEAAAGRELELSASGTLRERGIAPDDAAWSWVQTLASAPDFETRAVLAYLEWIARETGKRLQFDSRSTRLSAQFVSWSGDTIGLTPLEVLSTIAATSDFSYELTGDGAILIRRRIDR